jgi:glycerophosphoryl diester phosphodiesterase
MIYIQIAICAAAALLIINMLLLAPGRFTNNMNPVLWRTLYAHRGLHTKDKTVPENSMASFSAAVNAGYGMELDVNITADDKIVVFHDDDLNRVCGVNKKINDCTYDELQQYRLHDTSETIPLFSDVLALVDGKTALVVELKMSRRNKALCEKTAALLDAYKGPYCIESFDPRIVRWFKKHRPHTVRGQLSAGRINYRGQPLYQGLLLSGLYTNIVTRPHFVAYKHEDIKRFKLGLYRLLGGKLAAWTVRDTDDETSLRRYFDVIIFEFFRPEVKQ